MSTLQLTTFEQAIANNLEGIAFFSVGACPGCDECRSDYGYDAQAEFDRAYESGDVCDEGSFSWQSCDSCGSSLGGNRYDAHGFIDGDLYHFSVCSDCLFYHANGDLPEQWEA